MQWNLPSRNHVGPEPTYDPANVPKKFGPLTWEPIPEEYYHTCQFALMRLITRLGTTMTDCNAAFLALGQKRTLLDVISDPRVWVSYNSCTYPDLFGLGFWHKGFYEIAIADQVFRRPNPIPMVAATLLHEMAHFAGASNHSNDAERTLLKCGFKDQYDPDAIGQIARGSVHRLA
jgi:hypothetical protein